MQVYRGMDIGTAKLTPDERRGVPHHLLDLLDVAEPATVAEFQGWARAAIDDCRARGVVPVLVGGSALYLRAVLDDFEFPGTDAGVRARLEAELAELGATALHARLAEADPAAAEVILPSNGRRIVRALEVVEITGRPYRANLPDHDYAYDDVVQIGLDVPRDVLDERIGLRVDQMWAAGLVDEVRRWSRWACATGGPRAARSATRRCCGYLAGAVHRGRGARGHRARDPAVRPPPGHLVQARPADRVAAVRRAGPARPRPRHPYPGGVSFPFVKGHGTRNDFVVLPDLDGSVHGDLDAARGHRAVRPPCRHRRRRRAARAAW